MRTTPIQAPHEARARLVDHAPEGVERNVEMILEQRLSAVLRHDLTRIRSRATDGILFLAQRFLGILVVVVLL